MDAKEIAAGLPPDDGHDKQQEALPPRPPLATPAPLLPPTSSSEEEEEEVPAAVVTPIIPPSPRSATPILSDPEHEKAIRTVLHAGGLDKGAKVWVPKEKATGWVRARLVSKEEGKDGMTTFTVVEEGGGGGGEGKNKGAAAVARVLSCTRTSDGHYPLVHLANEELDVAASEGEAVAIDDLIKLTHLHEPAILHTIELRYWKDRIYTNTGPILIAVNPFKPLEIYADEILNDYRAAGQRLAARMDGQEANNSNGSSNNSDTTLVVDEAPLPPHIYAVADAAYRAMMGPLAAQSGALSPNQSILVSGESGAGKTESTKFIMNYLAVISSTSTTTSTDLLEEDSIASQVLQSNPILESLGNARTIRNDNSSRFGKFIELHFGREGGDLTGASIATYLLEKVRIVSQAKNERNYHIFYQLLKGATAEERELLGLSDYLPTQTHTHTQAEGTENDIHANGAGFHYLSQSGCMSRLDGADDAEDFLKTKRAMEIMGFSLEEQQSVTKVVAAVLHLGNLRFGVRPALTEEEALRPDEAQVDGGSVKTAERIASLLEVDPQAFQRSLTDRQIQAGRELVKVTVSPAQAEGARDALAKAVYGNLFLWVVGRVNAAIHTQRQQQGVAVGVGDEEAAAAAAAAHTHTQTLTQAPAAKNFSFIGVLDIFGFETFEKNCFEQFCINYANETLQQQFNQFVFKLEQEEYEKEDISWSFVEFPDNQACLDLLENRTHGILALLDEQCVVPKATDHSLANRLYETCKDHERFLVSSKDRVDYRFTVKHYAGDVTYDTAGFLEKNKDQLYQETVDLLRSSRCGVVQALGETSPVAAAATTTTTALSTSGGGGGGGGSGGGKRRSAVAPLTVGTQFKGQLSLLLQRIRSTRPHYVRCLKPNDKNVADSFDQARIIEQLRCGGVLEAVRVSRAGYPTRMGHAQFNQRYRPLALDGYHKAAVKAARAGGGGGGEGERERQLAEAVIRELATILWRKRREEGAVSLPSEKERAGLDLKEVLGHVGLQLGRTKVFFRLQAFEELETMRGRLLRVMAVKCQAVIRAWTRRRAYLRLKAATIVAQRLVRGFRARQEAQRLREERAATRIQAVVRGRQAQQELRTALRLVVSLQCLWRRELALRHLQELKQGQAAVRLQAWARMSLAQRRRVKTQLSILQLQTYVRGFLAKKELRRLRVEAKDLGKVIQERNQLREALRALQAELAVAVKEREQQVRALEEEKAQQEEKVGALEEKVQALEAELMEERKKDRGDSDLKTGGVVAAGVGGAAAVASAAALVTEVQLLRSRVSELEEALVSGGGATEEGEDKQGEEDRGHQQQQQQQQQKQPQGKRVEHHLFYYKKQIQSLEDDLALSKREAAKYKAAAVAAAAGAGAEGSLPEQGEGLSRETSSSDVPPSLSSKRDSFYSAVSELEGGAASYNNKDKDKENNSNINNINRGLSSSLLLEEEDLSSMVLEEGEGDTETDVKNLDNNGAPVSPTQTEEEKAAAEEAAQAEEDLAMRFQQEHPQSSPPTKVKSAPTTPAVPATATTATTATTTTTTTTTQDAQVQADGQATITPPSIKSRFLSTVSEMPTKAFLLLFAKSEDTDAVLEMLRARLAKEPQQTWEEVVNATDEDGRTPLHLAALGGSPRIVDLLLAHGAQLNASDKREDTPLHLTANEGVTKLLLGQGADPGLPNRLKEVALHLAVRHRDILSVQALLEKPRHRRFVNERDEKWDTPLHLACQVGLLDAVALLCEHEAFKEASNKEGLRPLHVIASSQDQLEQGPGIVHYLLHAGADGACRTPKGWTPLHFLCDNPAYLANPTHVCDMADLLLDRGVSVDIAALDGATPLHLAARNNFEELSALLIRRGASLTIPWRIPGELPEGWESSAEGGEGGEGEESALGSPLFMPRSRASSIAAEATTATTTTTTTAVDIFTERSHDQLERMIGEISAPQEQVHDNSRSNCMECQDNFTLLNRRHHCRFCQRLLCQGCSAAQVPREMLPPSFTTEKRAFLRVCHICHTVLNKRQQLAEAKALKKMMKKAGAANGGGGGGDGNGTQTHTHTLSISGESTEYVRFNDVTTIRSKLQDLQLQQQQTHTPLTAGEVAEALSSSLLSVGVGVGVSAGVVQGEGGGVNGSGVEGEGGEGGEGAAKKKKRRKKKKNKKSKTAVVGEEGEEGEGEGEGEEEEVVEEAVAVVAAEKEGGGEGEGEGKAAAVVAQEKGEEEVETEVEAAAGGGDGGDVTHTPASAASAEGEDGGEEQQEKKKKRKKKKKSQKA